jgi:hypothetical protein
MHRSVRMDATVNRARRARTLRSLGRRIELQLRLQREVLWHPRLGLAGTRHPALVGIGVVTRRSWTRR